MPQLAVMRPSLRLADDDEAERIAKTVPGGKVFSVGAKELDPLVPSIADVKAVLRVDGQGMGGGELAALLSFAPPLHDELSCG